MKITKTENGITLKPESDFERECLQHIADHKTVALEWSDSWNRTGDLHATFKPDSYDNY